MVSAGKQEGRSPNRLWYVRDFRPPRVRRLATSRPSRRAPTGKYKEPTVRITDDTGTRSLAKGTSTNTRKRLCLFVSALDSNFPSVHRSRVSPHTEGAGRTHRVPPADSRLWSRSTALTTLFQYDRSRNAHLSFRVR